MNVHSHNHVQSVAATTWTITHGLSCNPNVSAKVMNNGALTGIIPKDIRYPDINTVVIEFSTPRAGEARLA